MISWVRFWIWMLLMMRLTVAVSVTIMDLSHALPTCFNNARQAMIHFACYGKKKFLKMLLSKFQTSCIIPTLITSSTAVLNLKKRKYAPASFFIFLQSTSTTGDYQWSSGVVESWYPQGVWYNKKICKHCIGTVRLGWIDHPQIGRLLFSATTGRFLFWNSRWVLQCLNHSLQVSEWKSHQWLLRISTTQFLHAKFGEIFENKITNNLRVTPTQPLNLWPP
jgi:hypothetical protein